MRFAGIGLLVVGAGVAALGGIAAGEAAGMMACIMVGGFMFVAGTVFACSAGVIDAIRGNGRS